MLTNEEYDLISGDKTNVVEKKRDCWIDKWSLPLTWACEMIKQEFRKEGEKVVPDSSKKIIEEICDYQRCLLEIVTSLENRLPKIQTQAVTFAVYVFIFVGVIAGQGTVNRFDNDRLGWWCIIINFPFIELVKYALIVAWLKVAIYLRNPFGRDLGYDVDMVAYLDTEIWKSGCIIQSDIPIS